MTSNTTTLTVEINVKDAGQTKFPFLTLLDATRRDIEDGYISGHGGAESANYKFKLLRKKAFPEESLPKKYRICEVERSDGEGVVGWYGIFSEGDGGVIAYFHERKLAELFLKSLLSPPSSTLVKDVVPLNNNPEPYL